MKDKLHSNYIYNTLYQVLILAIPLLMTPFVTRVLGAEALGQYSYTRSVVTMFVLVGTAGSNMYAQREIAYVSGDEEKRQKTFWEIFLLRCLVLIVSLIAFFYFQVMRGLYPLLFLIQALDIVAAMMDISWYFQGLEEFKRITIRNSIIKVLIAIAILLCVRSSEDLWIYVLIYSLGNVIGQGYMWVRLPAKVGMPWRHSLNIMRHLKGISLLFIPQIAIQIYLVIDKTMIELLTGKSELTGYYELAQTIQRTGVMLVTAFGTVTATRIAALSQKEEENKIRNIIAESYEIVCLIGAPVAFGIGAVASNLVPWFMGKDYMPVISLLCVLSPLIIIIGFSNISGIQYMVPMGMQNKMTMSTIAGAIVNVILNYFFIPQNGAIGAAVASLIAEMFVMMIQLFYIRNILVVKRLAGSMAKALFSGTIMLVVIELLENNLWQEPTIWHTICLTLIGGGVYLCMQVICKNTLLLNVAKQVVKRGKNNV